MKRRICGLAAPNRWGPGSNIESLIGFGLRDVTIEYSTNGTDYTTLGTTHEFARASGTAGYAHEAVDFGSAAAKYVRLTATSNWGGVLPQYGLSEVRFLHIPVSATRPNPDSGATGVPLDVILGWRAGREAVTHDVYISTDEQAVTDRTAPVATVTEAKHGPLSLDLDVTHYWRVDEVNEAETPTTWESNIWSFRVSDHSLVMKILLSVRRLSFTVVSSRCRSSTPTPAAQRIRRQN
ncbi:MAG: hypothetical protein ACYS4T_18005 [Planctomycetota bacterium]|jgi:hypothetical protein